MHATSTELLLAALAVGVAAYLAVGLAPFTFDFSRPVRVHLLFVTPVNGVLNFLCFVPLGVIVALLCAAGRPVLAAFVVCGVLSLAVETAQIFIPGRFACVSDWLLNTAGAVSGGWWAVQSAG